MVEDVQSSTFKVQGSSSGVPQSGLLGMRTAQRNFFQEVKRRRLTAAKWRRQFGKTTTLGKIAIFKMMKRRNHTVVFGSAKLSLATEIVRKQEAAFDDFGSRLDIQREAGLFQDLANASAEEVRAAGQLLKVADAHSGKEIDGIGRDDFAEIFEARRLEFRIYHDRTSYSRTKVIALTPSAVGETGDMMADEIARIKNWGEVWEAIEPIISSDPEFRCCLSTTPAPDDTHLAYEMLMEPPGLDLPVRAEGNWFRSEFGVDVLRVTAYDAHADGIMLFDTNSGEPVTPEEHRKKARDDAAWLRNYGAQDVQGGTGAIGLVAMNAAQIRGQDRCLHVEVKCDADLEEALVWLGAMLGSGRVGCGWDLATTTKETSNPSAFTVTEQFGGVYIERLICTWKLESDELMEARARAILETIASRPEGGRARRLCIDASNEILFARRMRRVLGSLTTVELVVASVTAPVQDDDGNNMNYKTWLGGQYMQLFGESQIDVPASKYIKDDHRMVKKERGLFVCQPDKDGKHGDTFDSGKLSVHALHSTGGGIEDVEGVVIGAPDFTPSVYRPAVLGGVSWE